MVRFGKPIRQSLVGQGLRITESSFPESISKSVISELCWSLVFTYHLNRLLDSQQLKETSCSATPSVKQCCSLV